jgi:hypothetical protein
MRVADYSRRRRPGSTREVPRRRPALAEPLRYQTEPGRDPVPVQPRTGG